jgi:hypothetical protein
MQQPFRPDLSVKYAPRINRRFARMADRIAAREQMRKGDVLQYCFEAAVANGRLTRSGSSSALALDAMLTVRTSKKMRGRVYELWRDNPNMLEADVLRGLLEWVLPIAIEKRISYVMKLREAAI